MRVRLLLAVSFLVPLMALGQSSPGFTSPEAKEALSRYRDAEHKARQRYEKELLTALDLVAQRAELEETYRIEDELERLAKDAVSRSTPRTEAELPTWLAKTKWSRPGHKTVMWFTEDGRFGDSAGNEGRYEVTGASTFQRIWKGDSRTPCVLSSDYTSFTEKSPTAGALKWVRVD